MTRRPCHSCRALCDRYERVEKRIEYRRVHDEGRQHVVKLGELCHSCAAEEVRAARGEPVVEQGALL